MKLKDWKKGWVEELELRNSLETPKSNDLKTSGFSEKELSKQDPCIKAGDIRFLMPQLMRGGSRASFVLVLEIAENSDAIIVPFSCVNVPFPDSGEYLISEKSVNTQVLQCWNRRKFKIENLKMSMEWISCEDEIEKIKNFIREKGDVIPSFQEYVDSDTLRFNGIGERLV